MIKGEDYNFLQAISAILPVYDENGANVCQVFYMTGESAIVKMRLERFLDHWTCAFGIHLGAQRRWARNILDISNRLPILIDAGNAFIPIKTMRPIGSKDSCHGFIHQKSIKNFHETRIDLHNGVTIPYFSTIKTLKRKLCQANHLSYAYRDKAIKRQGVYDNNRKLEVAKQLSFFYDFLRDDTLSLPPPY